MGGHLDDAEHNLNTPIVSLSLGLSGLFLIGGPKKTDEPKVILLKSGDAIVMAGPSRLCYHGVPMIISKEIENFLLPNDEYTIPSISNYPNINIENQHVINYLHLNRLNMNSRQVRKSDENNINNISEEWIDKTGTGYVKI